MKRLFVYLFGFAVASTLVSCGELTGPTSPETPVNVTATLITGSSAEIRWQPSPQSDGVVSYNILRNGQKIAESGTTSYTDTGLAELTTYKYTISANCKGGILSDPSAESPAATVTTKDLTPPRVTVISPFANQTGVSIFATVTVTFNEAMDAATINTTTFTLKVASTGANIPGAVTYNTTTRTATFTPSSTLPSATDITVTITTGMKDVSGNALFTSPGSPGFWTFTTADFEGPRVTAVSPANGATGVSGSTAVIITFSEALDASTVNTTTITLKVTSTGASVPGVVTYNATTHVVTFTPSVTLASATNYTLTVSGSVKDVSGNEMRDAFESSFTILDTTAPTVVSTSPANLATNVPTNTTISATFSKPMDPATINPGTFVVRNAATGIAIAVGSLTYNSSTRTATFTPAAPLASFTTYTAQLTTGAKDTFGNSLANFNWTFSTADVAPPIVSTVSPTNGQSNVATNSAVTITFSKAMDASTLTAANVTLKNTATSAVVAGEYSYNSSTNVLTFTPAVVLANGTNYTLTVSTGAKDASGNALASQFTSAFTTAPAPDTTPPGVVSISPANGATNVVTGTTVNVTFSESMDAATITAANITLKNTATSAAVTGGVTYNSTTHVATFTPSTSLAASTDYTVTVTTGVKDAAGNALPSLVTSTFTTEAPPIVSTVSPTNGQSNVATNSAVNIAFSKPMDVSTITSTNIILKNTATSAVVAGEFTYNASTRVATFTPAVVLANGANYTLTVTTGVKDASGNALATQFTSTFTTVADVTPPTVTGTTPTNGATAVPVNTTVTVTFSEAMDPATINTTTISLKVTATSAAVTGTVAYNAATHVATFTPSASLTANTNYTATVSTGAKDAAGNALAGTFTFTFTTAP